MHHVWFESQSFRQHGEQLLQLTREVRDVRAFAWGAVEGHRKQVANLELKPSAQDVVERVDLVQAKVEALAEQRSMSQKVVQRVDEVDARLTSISCSISQEFRFLTQQVRDLEGALNSQAEGNEKTTKQTKHLQDQVQDLVSFVKELPMAVLSGSSLQTGTEDRMLQALERKVDMALHDLRCQLELQIEQISDREQRQRLESDSRAFEEARMQKMVFDVRKEFEQKLADAGMGTQQMLRELRQEFEARSSLSQRHGEDLRRELELKLDRKFSSSEMVLEEFRHTLDNLRTQQQGTLHKFSEEHPFWKGSYNFWGLVFRGSWKKAGQVGPAQRGHPSKVQQFSTQSYTTPSESQIPASK